MAGYLIDWIERLQREAAEARALLSEPVEDAKPLAIRIHRWWADMQATERKDYYTMGEFVALFADSPARIGVTLARLGWRRGRKWTGDVYARYWCPPQDAST